MSCSAFHALPNSSYRTGPTSIRSWYDAQRVHPVDPMELIAYATLNGSIGTPSNSSNFAAPGTWVASAWVLSGENEVSALGSDNQLAVHEAENWNWSHLTVDTAAALAPPLRRIVFMRGGTAWENRLHIDLGAAQYNDLQLSFRDNAGTRGDEAGTIPVIGWSGPSSGVLELAVRLRDVGRAVMAIRARNVASGDYSMFEMEWIIVA